jgi:hypothetical protein
MKTLPSFSALVRAYPNAANPADVFKLIGGKVESNNYPNSCVIRVSRALNYAGDPVRRRAGMLTSSGSDGKWYATRVAEFDLYMRATYGPPAVEAQGEARGPTDRTAFRGKRGVIEFKVTGWSNATGHFDLWDGQRCIHDDYSTRRVASVSGSRHPDAR